jgi:dihydrofolate reductase
VINSATIIHQLLRADLVDDLRFAIVPVRERNGWLAGSTASAVSAEGVSGTLLPGDDDEGPSRPISPAARRE